MSPKADDRTATRPKAGSKRTRIRDARVEPTHPIVCVAGGTRAKFEVRDISVSGMSVWSTIPVSRGWLHEFRLTYGQFTVVRQARAIHCKSCDDGRWLIGLEFDKKARRGPTIENLVDLITDETHVPVWS